MIACPSIELLQRVLDGDVDPVLHCMCEAHVEQCDACQTILERLTGSVPGFILPRDGDATVTATVDATGFRTQVAALPPAIAGYEMLGELGRGGMGVVYKARDLTLNRLVALKMVLAGPHAGEPALARFRREATVLAQLNDRHIVQIYEIGSHAGVPFLALEYIPGGRLADLLHEALPTPRQAAELVQRLALSMHAAHERGIVHRDLKPSNILIACDAEEESRRLALSWQTSWTPKITDFGLAKIIDEAAGHTLSGAVLGTPGYMAPEQAGDNRQVGPAADVYALGAILYETLTGRPPFRSHSPTDTVRQVLSEEPPSPRRLQRSVPADLDTICLKCLEKSPSQRYATTAELAGDLGRYLRHEPISARPVARPARVARWCRRHPALSAAMALGVLAALSLTALGIGYPFAMEQARSAAKLREEQHKTQQALDQVVKFRSQAEQLSATLALRQGLSLCEQGDAARGLHWLARSLELLPADQADLATAIRKNVTAWSRQVHVLDSVLPHEREIMVLALQSDGRRLAVGCWDHTALLWDVAAREAIGAPLKHRAAVTALAFSHDRQHLAAGCLDGSVWMWSLDTQQEPRTWQAHQEQIYGLAFSPDDRWLGSVGKDARARRWDPATGSALGSPLNHDGPVHCLAISPDARTLLTGSADQRLRHWDLNAEPSVATVIEHSSPIVSVAFSLDGASYVVGRRDGIAQVWDLASGLPRGRALEHRAMVTAVGFSADGRRVLTASRDKTGQLWDAGTGRAIGAPLRHHDEVTGIALTPDGQTLITTCEDRTLRFWRVAPATSELDAKPVSETRQAWPARQVFGMRWRTGLTQLAGFSPDGKVAYTMADGALELSKTSAIQLWRTETGSAIGQPLRHEELIIDVAFSPDGTQVATASSDQTAQVWDTRTAKALTALSHWEGLKAVAFRPDGEALLTAGGRRLRFWHCPSGKALGEPWNMEEPVEFAVYDHAGKRVAVAYSSGEVAICAVDAGQPAYILRAGDAGSVNSVSFSADDSAVLVSHWSGAVRIWRLFGDQFIETPMNNHEPVWAACFSPDGRLVATASAAGIVRVWDVSTRQQVGSPLLGSFVDDLAFSPDGRTLAVGDYESKVRIMDTAASLGIGPAEPNGSPVQHVCFSADGLSYQIAGHDRVLRRFATPEPWPGSVAQVVAEVQALTGLTLDADGVVSVLDLPAWQKAREQAAAR